MPLIEIEEALLSLSPSLRPHSYPLSRSLSGSGVLAWAPASLPLAEALPCPALSLSPARFSLERPGISAWAASFREKLSPLPPLPLSDALSRSASRAWIVAASIGAVEALKDQGISRWNHAFRNLQKQAKKSIGSYTQAKRLSPAASSSLQRKVDGLDRLKYFEESLSKVMYLSCWGPN